MSATPSHCKVVTHNQWPLPEEGPAASPFPLPGGWLLAKAAALTGWELPCISIGCSASDSLVSTALQQAQALDRQVSILQTSWGPCCSAAAGNSTALTGRNCMNLSAAFLSSVLRMRWSLQLAAAAQQQVPLLLAA